MQREQFPLGRRNSRGNLAQMCRDGCCGRSKCWKLNCARWKRRGWKDIREGDVGGAILGLLFYCLAVVLVARSSVLRTSSATPYAAERCDRLKPAISANVSNRPRSWLRF